MEPDLARFELAEPNVKVTKVNLDEAEDEPAKSLIDQHFQGASIPYTVLLDNEDRERARWLGYVSFERFVEEIAKLEQTPPEPTPPSGEENR